MSRFTQDKGYQAFRILQIAFIVAPIVAGLDKFFNLLTFWPQYLAPFASSVLHGHDALFMKLVGIVEIIAGILVWIKPRIFSYIVALWLLLIIINLLVLENYYDVLFRDIGLLLGALALGRLSAEYDVA